MSSLRSALAGLLSHDQAPSHSQWGLTLPVHGVPGVLQQPGRHAEAHQEPRGAGIPPWLDHQQHLPVQLTYLNQSSHQLKIKSLKVVTATFPQQIIFKGFAIYRLKLQQSRDSVAPFIQFCGHIVY